MPSGGIIAAAALAMMLYLAGSAVVHGVKKIGHGIRVGVARLVHPHKPAAPARDRRPADTSRSPFT